MSVHVNRAHHRPRVGTLPLNSVWRTLFGFRWESSCETCGHFHPSHSWHGAWVDALTHAETVR